MECLCLYDVDLGVEYCGGFEFVIEFLCLFLGKIILDSFKVRKFYMQGFLKIKFLIKYRYLQVYV